MYFYCIYLNLFHYLSKFYRYRCAACITDLSMKLFISDYGQNDIISMSFEKYDDIYDHKLLLLLLLLYLLLYAILYNIYVTNILSCQIGPS